MVLDSLGRSLHSALKRISKSAHVDEEAIKDMVEDIQRALLQADVNVQLVMDLTDRIEERALKEEVLPGASRREHVVKIVYEELSEFLGETEDIRLRKGEPKILMMVGLQGSGKTTSVAKLSNYFKKRGYQPAMICADTYRPGAPEQLEQLGDQIGVPVYTDPEGSDAVKLAEEGKRQFEEDSIDVILIDTAGRHREEEELMDEMERMADEVEPDEIILTIDGTLGQQAESQAAAFKEATDIGSIFVTKLDGTAKGGGALSAVSATGAPIKLVGTGEKVDDLEKFSPERFASRLLGMGDIETLLEKIEETAEREQIEPQRAKELLKGKLTLRDVYQQLEQLSSMGSLNKILQMIPGMGMSIPEDEIMVGEKKLERFKVIMDSMTEDELDEPKLINSSRIKRIAEGSGSSEGEVKELLDQYNMMQKMMKSLGKGRGPPGDLQKLLKRAPKDLF